MSLATKAKTFAGIIAVGVILLAAGFFDQDGGGNPDYSDTNKYRLAAYKVHWVQLNKAPTKIIANYTIGSSVGTDSSRDSPLVVNGYVTQGQTFSVYYQVQNVSEERVTNISCQAYLDGNPIPSDVQQEPGRWGRCTAVASW